MRVLVPVRHLSLDPNVCGLRRRLGVGYCNEDLPLEETTFLDIWDVFSSNNYAKH